MQDAFIVGFREETIAGGATFTLDGSKENAVSLLPTGNILFDAVNLKRGVPYMIALTQDGVGGRTIDFSPLDARYARAFRCATANTPDPAANRQTTYILMRLSNPGAESTSRVALVMTKA